MLTIESPQQLREVIQSALGDELGTYTFENGLSAPAIAYAPNLSDYPPANTVVAGLEVVIIPPSPSILPLIQGYAVENKWILYLKQWNPSKTPRPALNRLLGVVKSIKRVIPVPANKKLGIPETYQVTLEDWDGVSWLI